MVGPKWNGFAGNNLFEPTHPMTFDSPGENNEKLQIHYFCSDLDLSYFRNRFWRNNFHYSSWNYFDN